MPKAVSSARKTYLAGEVTTETICWRITRTDGVEFFFTTFDQDLVIGGNRYIAASGYNATAISNEAGFGVNNMDVAGFFDDEAIKEEELRAGLFNYAEVRIFAFNWADLTQDETKLLRGWFGEATMSKQGIFQIELRGLTQPVQQTIGEFYTPECKADLGDSRCKIPIWPVEIARSTAYVLGDVVRVPDTIPAPDASAYHDRIFICTQAGLTSVSAPVYDYTVNAVTTDGGAKFKAVEAWTRAGVVAVGVQTTAGNRKQFNVTISESRAVDGWFNGGVLTWESGKSAGKSVEVRSWVQTGGVMTLFLSCPYVPAVGDKFRVYRGCNRLKPTCIEVFGNMVNFRGYPDIPGNSALTDYGNGSL